jgi:hypothetical protein
MEVEKMFDENNEQIVFIAKHKEWVVIKKLLIDQKVSLQEIGLILAGIQKSIYEKSFEYFKIDTKKINQLAQNFAASKRKSISSIGEIFSSINSSQLKKDLLNCCQKEDHYPLAEQYFIISLLSELGYEPYPNLEIIQKLYPELKIPKPKGNFKKSK